MTLNPLIMVSVFEPDLGNGPEGFMFKHEVDLLLVRLELAELLDLVGLQEAGDEA